MILTAGSLMWRAFVLAILILFLPAALWSVDQATPAATAAQWLSDPDSSLVAVLHLAGTLVQAAQGISWTGWLLGGLGAAVAVLRFTPVWGPILGSLYDLLAPRKTVEAERAQAVQAKGFEVLVKTIERLPPDSTLAKLRDKLSTKMPEAVKDAVEQYLDQRGHTLHAEALHVVSTAPLAPLPEAKV